MPKRQPQVPSRSERLVAISSDARYLSALYEVFKHNAVQIVLGARSWLLTEPLDREALAHDMASKAVLAVLREFLDTVQPELVVISYGRKTMRNAMLDELRKLDVRRNVSVRPRDHQADDESQVSTQFIDHAADPCTEDADYMILGRLSTADTQRRLVEALVERLAPPSRTRAAVRALVSNIVGQSILPEARPDVLTLLRTAIPLEGANASAKEVVALLMKMLEASGGEIAKSIGVAESSAATYVMRGRAFVADLLGVATTSAPRRRSLMPRQPRVRIRYLLAHAGVRVSELDIDMLACATAAPSPDRLAVLRRAALGDISIARRLLATPLFRESLRTVASRLRTIDDET